MKYLMLIYVTEFSSRPGEENEFSGAWRAYRQALLDAPGVYLGGEGLQPPSTAKTVWLERGKRRVHDGPFAETKEQLGGYVLLEQPSLEDALEWAARCPAAVYGRKSGRSSLTTVPAPERATHRGPMNDTYTNPHKRRRRTKC